MQPEFQDYYAALGLSPDADDKAIKQAYRKLARQYHPDVNPGDSKAEERFKEVNEAYQVLSDPEKRAKYDQMRQNYQQWQQRGGQPGGFNWGDWQAGPGEYTYTNISPEDLQDMFGEEDPFSDFFGSIFGQYGGSARQQAQRPRAGRDAEVLVHVTLEEAFHGTTRTIQRGERRIEARIPAGVRSGSRIRLANQGHPGVAGGQAGDLYLVIEVEPHAVFERDGDDLIADVPVDIYTAAAGGEARVPTIDGSVMLKIPPRTQAEKTFRLRNKGMPHLEKPEQRGDMYARVKLVLPHSMSDDEVETLKSLKQKQQV